MKPLLLTGFVESGEGMAGSMLNCPTANIAIKQGDLIPGLGVYVGLTEFEAVQYPSLICVSGGRTGVQLKVEVHLLDQTKELYGKRLSILIIDRIRDIVPFPGIQKMAEMIAQDVIDAKTWFSTHPVAEFLGNIPKI